MLRQYCVFNNAFYGDGSVICQSGRQLVCVVPENNSAYWKDTGRSCESHLLSGTGDLNFLAENDGVRNNLWVEYSDQDKVVFKTNPGSSKQFTIKNRLSGASQKFRIEDRRTILYSQYPRAVTGDWIVSSVEPIDPNWGRDITSAFDFDPRTGVAMGNPAAYTAAVIRRTILPGSNSGGEGTTSEITRIVPPGRRMTVSYPTKYHLVELVSAHLDDDHISGLDIYNTNDDDPIVGGDPSA